MTTTKIRIRNAKGQDTNATLRQVHNAIPARLVSIRCFNHYVELTTLGLLTNRALALINHLENSLSAARVGLVS